jgi:hypothetical protein
MEQQIFFPNQEPESTQCPVRHCESAVQIVPMTKSPPPPSTGVSPDESFIPESGSGGGSVPPSTIFPSALPASPPESGAISESARTSVKASGCSPRWSATRASDRGSTDRSADESDIVFVLPSHPRPRNRTMRAIEKRDMVEVLSFEKDSTLPGDMQTTSNCIIGRV